MAVLFPNYILILDAELAWVIITHCIAHIRIGQPLTYTCIEPGDGTCAEALGSLDYDSSSEGVSPYLNSIVSSRYIGNVDASPKAECL